MMNLEATASMHQPLVSVLMLVYNHERWLAHAIESVMMQRTNFDYELIISEDCSTDRSREIAIRYYDKYPNRIRLLLNDNNLGMADNFRQVIETATGKYIAFLEGDDYWTDPYKLQLQVDFLEGNPDYSGCCHSVQVVDEKDNLIIINRPEYESLEEYDYDIEAWKKCCQPGQTSSIVHRNILNNMSKELLNAFVCCRDNGDGKLVVLLLIYGKIKRMGKRMGCYRRTYTGSSYNARMKGTALRLFDYTRALEREKFALRYMDVGFLSHDISRNILKFAMEDRLQGAEANKLLEKMVSYNIKDFVALAVATDFDRIHEGKAVLLIDGKAILGDKDERIIIMGTGNFGEVCCDSLIQLELWDRVLCVWDNNTQKQGGFFHERRIETPSREYIGRNIYIIIASVAYAEEMQKQLEELGYVFSKQLFLFQSNWKQFLRRRFWNIVQKQYPILMATNNGTECF